jgi:hypothetical protein
MCEVRQASEAPIHRMKLSKEEIDIINNGGVESVGDWRKIKMM